LVNKLIISASASKFPESSAFIFEGFLDLLRHHQYESLSRWQMSLCSRGDNHSKTKPVKGAGGSDPLKKWYCLLRMNCVG
jgi:hypothetical protein